MAARAKEWSGTFGDEGAGVQRSEGSEVAGIKHAGLAGWELVQVLRSLGNCAGG